MDYIQVEECINLLQQVAKNGVESLSKAELLYLTCHMGDILRELERLDDD